MTQNEIKRIEQIIKNFQFEGHLVHIEPWGNGHINDTFLLTFEIGKMGLIQVILQRINKNVFPKPEEVMENMMNVTSHLHKKILENGGNPYRETVNVIPSIDNKPYYKETENDYWRSTMFIADATCYEVAESVEDFYQSAVAFGKFQSLLADFPAEELHETIKNFNN